MRRWDSLLARVRTAPKLRMVQTAWQLCPVWVALLGAWAIANAVAPLLLTAAMGALVGRVPAVIDDGMASAAGDRLIVALVVASALLVVTLLLAPLRDALSPLVAVRFTHAMQARLMRAVSNPTGIAHLEDPQVLDRVTMAQGSLMNTAPGEAPGAYAAVLSNKLSGLLACVIVGVFRWWLGLGILVFWLVYRRVLRSEMRKIVGAFSGEANVIRRAWYFSALASRPEAAKELRIFGLRDWVIDRYRTHYLDGMGRVWKRMRRESRVIIAAVIVATALYGATYWTIADSALSGQTSLAVVTALLPMTVFTSFVGIVDRYDWTLEFALSSLPKLDEMEESLGVTATRVNEPAPPAPSDIRHEIRFDDVGFTYPGGSSPVFESLALSLPVGSSTAIVGANGAGKTTIVKLLARLYEPTSGRIMVDGTDISTFDAASWQRNVAVVFQDFAQMPLRAFENVGYGASEHLDDFDGMANAARRAGALEIIDGLPDGWHTVLSREFSGGVDLSGGQWQRVALARALFAVDHGAQILVLDEPTAWLDVRGEAEFFDQFLEITAGLTTIVISHRFSTVRQASRICVIEHGQVVEEGDHDSLVAGGGAYAAAFTLQASRFGGADERDEPADGLPESPVAP